MLVLSGLCVILSSPVKKTINKNSGGKYGRYIKKVTRRFPDHKLLKQLYKKAFPIEERAPFWLLSAKAKKENVDFWAIYDSHKFVGLIYIVNYADLSYIFYFAVLDSERGKGYGSKVLETVKQKVSEPQDLFLRSNSLMKIQKIMIFALSASVFTDRTALWLLT